MKTTILSALILSLSVSMITVQAANNSGAVKAELDSQKNIITDNKFYPATNVFYTNNGVFVPTFKEQLDSQKTAKRDYNFYPATDVSYKYTTDVDNSIADQQVAYYTSEGIFVPTFEEQLESQKNLQLKYKFYPITAVFLQSKQDAKNMTVKAQLDSQKALLKDYNFYPATDVYYTHDGVILPSFKEQLDSQEKAVRDYKFYPAMNVVYTDKGVYAPTVKTQLDSQKSLLRNYKFYPAMSVSYLNK